MNISFPSDQTNRLRIAFIVVVILLSMLIIRSSNVPLQGLLTDIGIKGGRTVTQMTFDQGELSEVIPVNNLTIALVPDAQNISDGALLSLALTSGKRVFGYKYTSYNAEAEMEAKARSDNGEPLSYSELFPGQFFVSSVERNANTFIVDFETQKNVAFLTPSQVTLDRHARYIFVASDPATRLTVRELLWCGNGIPDGIEECDDGNNLNTDACTNFCKNAVCLDGFVQPSEACDDGNLFDTDLCTNACQISCGNGIFAPSVNYLNGDPPPYPISFTTLDHTLAFADLNNDGIPDKVQANVNVTTTRTISVFIGYGNNRYNAPTELSLGIHTPSAVAIGDLNSDTKMDIAVSHGPNNSVTVFWGNGLGGFTMHGVRFPTDNKPESIMIADIDGDDIMDIATGNQGYFGQTGGKSISVIRGKGQGAFSPAVQYSTISIPKYIFSADMDNDGIKDLVSFSIGNSVSILLGTAQGTFSSPILYRTIDYPNAVTIADLDGDSIIDIATRRLVSGMEASISVLLGKEEGSCPDSTLP